MFKKALVLSAWMLCAVSNGQASNEENIIDAGVFVCDASEQKCVRGEENDSTLNVFHHQEKEGHVVACRKCQ